MKVRAQWLWVIRMSNLKELDKKYIANTYNRFNLNIVKANGSLVYDENGKEYIDLGSGIGVTAFGFNDEAYKNAITEQLNLYQHTSNLYYTEPCVKLAELLCNKTGFKKVFFSNSGAESNECAIKVARKYAAEKRGSNCYKIITLINSFHGRTITTLAATGQDVFHKDFLPLTDGFINLPANDFESIKAQNKDEIAAIMLETIQGEGGVNPLNQEYLSAVYDYCNKNDILLIVDEVQTGNGRTGKLYSYEHFNIMPDIVSTAKGLGGGLPIGATLLGEKVENVLGFSDHGSTFGANPVCAAAALSIMSRIDKALLQEVNKKSEYIFNALKNCDGVLSLSGKGLMIGIETKKDAKIIVSELLEKGVLCLTAKTKLRLLPALNIPFKDLEKAIEIIKTCL